MKKDNTIRLLCRQCKILTTHNVFKSARLVTYAEQYDFDDELAETEKEESYQILCCQNCEIYGFRLETSYPLPMYETHECGPPTIEEKLYPEYNSSYYQPRSREGIPPQIYQIYFEVIKAYNGNSQILTMAGLRMLMECICKHEEGQGSLNEQINDLRSKNKLSQSHADIFHKLRQQGNESVHQFQQLQKREILPYLNVIESTLDLLYVHTKLLKE